MPRRLSRAALLCASALALSACGASAKDFALLRDDVTRLHKENAELQKRIGELEAHEATRTNDAIAKKDAPDADAKASAATASDGKPLKVVKLAPAAVSTPSPQPEAPPPADDDDVRPVLKIGPSGAIEQTIPDEATADGKSKKKKKAAIPALDPQAAKDYDAAYALVKTKKYQSALDALAGFLVRWPDHPYAANALYWRGECYWAQGDYASSASQFDALVIRFPASAKAADGLLKLGMAHRKLGSVEKARAAFERLRKEFPTSEAAKKIPPEEAS